MPRLFAILVLVTGFWPMQVAAGTPKVIEWDDLVPEIEAPDDPYENLSIDQRFELSAIAKIRKLRELNLIDDNNPGVMDAIKYNEKLEGEGLDVEWYLRADAEYRAVMEEGRRQTRTELNGTDVRIAGYMLPLEYKDDAVTEMLLVPYVGACIHVPPPPPNQMIHVKLATPFKTNRVYTPVWLTGKLVTRSSVSSLTLVDGSADIHTGYSMDVGVIEPYTVPAK